METQLANKSTEFCNVLEVMEILEENRRNSDPMNNPSLYMANELEDANGLSAEEIAEDMSVIFGGTCRYWLGQIERYEHEEEEYYRNFYSEVK